MVLPAPGALYQKYSAFRKSTANNVIRARNSGTCFSVGWDCEEFRPIFDSYQRSKSANFGRCATAP